jgi:ABC-type transporter Mla subunit MlaD
MSNPNLITIFLAVVTLAVLIQAGILVGFYFATLKLNRHVDRALSTSEKLVDPVKNIVNNLSTFSARLSEVGRGVREDLREARLNVEQAEASWHETLDRWTKRAG